MSFVNVVTTSLQRSLLTKTSYFNIIAILSSQQAHYVKKRSLVVITLRVDVTFPQCSHNVLYQPNYLE